MNMNNPIQTIRDALLRFSSDYQCADKAIAALAELEKQEPVAFVCGADLERLKAGESTPAYTIWGSPWPTPLYAAPVAQQPQALTRNRIREIFMSHGFTVKDGQTDLKEYVYDAAAALLAEAQQPQAEVVPSCLHKEQSEVVGSITRGSDGKLHIKWVEGKASIGDTVVISSPQVEATKWAAFVASMIVGYLDDPAVTKKEAAIAGIIARRVWALGVFNL
jgi:hypothetical protein